MTATPADTAAETAAVTEAAEDIAEHALAIGAADVAEWRRCCAPGRADAIITRALAAADLGTDDTDEVLRLADVGLAATWAAEGMG
jgi:delta 1-pyrroline-5-carboxylate dehydrogenase